MTRTKLNVGAWLMRVLGWDGLLPLAVVAIPYAIELAIPNSPNVIVATAIILPIAAFLIRIREGGRQIASNNCGPLHRVVQYYVFCAGAFVLLLIDALIVTSHTIPAGAMFPSKEDWLILGAMAAIYLTAMAIAMYPGRNASAPVAGAVEQ